MGDRRGLGKRSRHIRPPIHMNWIGDVLFPSERMAIYDFGMKRRGICTGWGRRSACYNQTPTHSSAILPRFREKQIGLYKPFDKKTVAGSERLHRRKGCTHHIAFSFTQVDMKRTCQSRIKQDAAHPLKGGELVDQRFSSPFAHGACQISRGRKGAVRAVRIGFVIDWKQIAFKCLTAGPKIVGELGLGTSFAR